MTAADCPDLERFIRGELDPRTFSHHEHVRMGFEMLRRHEFCLAALSYSQALRRMTAAAGKPEAFHQTTTIAFLSLIAERLESSAPQDFAAFQRMHPELLDRALLARWYRGARLSQQAARRTFLLPDPLP